MASTPYARQGQARRREMLRGVPCLSYTAAGWQMDLVDRDLLEACDLEGYEDLDAGAGLSDATRARICAELDAVPLTVFERGPSLPPNVIPLRQRQEVPDPMANITLAEVRRGDRITRWNGRPVDITVAYVDETPDFRVVVQDTNGKKIKGHRSTRIVVEDQQPDGEQSELFG